MLRARRVTSLKDRLAATEVGHASSPPEKAPPIEYYQAVRLRLARRAQGEWWLLEEDGRPVSMLMRYPLTFAADGETLPGYGLGGVATRRDAQGRGHASALCRAAIDSAEAEGRRVGLLFSAIPPPLYERLGFAVAPAWQPTCSRLGDLAAGGPRATLLPLDPRAEARGLAERYEAFHEGLHLVRDADAWRRVVDLNPTDEFFGVGEPTRGYLRVCFQDPEVAEVVECIASPRDAAPALRALADLASRLGRKRMAGWFEVPAALRGEFEDAGRATTLPMVRGHPDLGRARFWSSDYF